MSMSRIPIGISTNTNTTMLQVWVWLCTLCTGSYITIVNAPSVSTSTSRYFLGMSTSMCKILKAWVWVPSGIPLGTEYEYTVLSMSTLLRLSSYTAIEKCPERVSPILYRSTRLRMSKGSHSRNMNQKPDHVRPIAIPLINVRLVLQHLHFLNFREALSLDDNLKICIFKNGKKIVHVVLKCVVRCDHTHFVISTNKVN